MHVPKLTDLLSVSSLEDEGYEVVFRDGTILIRSEGAGTQDAAVRLGIRKGCVG